MQMGSDSHTDNTSCNKATHACKQWTPGTDKAKPGDEQRVTPNLNIASRNDSTPLLLLGLLPSPQCRQANVVSPATSGVAEYADAPNELLTGHELGATSLLWVP